MEKNDQTDSEEKKEIEIDYIPYDSNGIFCLKIILFSLNVYII